THGRGGPSASRRALRACSKVRPSSRRTTASGVASSETYTRVGEASYVDLGVQHWMSAAPGQWWGVEMWPDIAAHADVEMHVPETPSTAQLDGPVVPPGRHWP